MNRFAAVNDNPVHRDINTWYPFFALERLENKKRKLSGFMTLCHGPYAKRISGKGRCSCVAPKPYVSVSWTELVAEIAKLFIPIATCMHEK